MKQLIVILIMSTAIPSARTSDQIYAPEFIGLSQLSQEYFSFSDSSPETQFDGWPTCRHGQWQSPIDISEPLEKSDLTIKFSQNYHEPLSKVALNNNGHYPQVTPFPSMPKRTLWFKGHEYIFEQMNFRSDSSDGHDGSGGHILFGHKYPFEVNFVHYSTKFDTLRDALEYKDGVLILSALFDIGHHNPYIEFVAANIADIAIANDTVSVKTDTALSDLLPSSGKMYYYKGSNDQPPCQETVNWIVFDHVQPISEQQLLCFKNVLRTESGLIEDRPFRFTQPRNHRNIYILDRGHRDHDDQRPEYEPRYRTNKIRSDNDYWKEYDGDHDHNGDGNGYGHRYGEGKYGAGYDRP